MVTDLPWDLSRTTWKTVRDATYQVAVLPWGATEAHNFHLPYATDSIEAAHVAIESCRQAWAMGTRAVALPVVPFGVNTGQRDIPLCLNMMPTTQTALLADLLVAIDAAGIGALVILNSHGGNDFRQIIRELQPAARALLCTINWYSCVDPRPFFAEPGDHAGELETSVMQHLTPDLVLPLDQAGPGHAKSFSVRAFREGWAWTPRQWSQLTGDTGVGNPAQASAERGKAFLAAACQQVAGFLVELAATPADNMYMDPSGPGLGG